MTRKRTLSNAKTLSTIAPSVKSGQGKQPEHALEMGFLAGLTDIPGSIDGLFADDGGGAGARASSTSRAGSANNQHGPYFGHGESSFRQTDASDKNHREDGDMNAISMVEQAMAALVNGVNNDQTDENEEPLNNPFRLSPTDKPSPKTRSATKRQQGIAPMPSMDPPGSSTQPQIKRPRGRPPSAHKIGSLAVATGTPSSTPATKSSTSPSIMASVGATSGGLRSFSSKVCDTVERKGSTTYNEVLPFGLMTFICCAVIVSRIFTIGCR